MADWLNMDGHMYVKKMNIRDVSLNNTACKLCQCFNAISRVGSHLRINYSSTQVSLILLSNIIN